MKLSTARKAWLLSFVSPEKAVALMFTAQRICINGQTKRYGYADGSVLESVNGVWKVVKKNPKLEAAVKRYGCYLRRMEDGAPVDPRVYADDDQASPGPAKPFVSERTVRLQMEVLKLQELLNEKDEQLDKATRPMVVRLDWWLVGLVGLVLVANGLGYM